MPICFNTYQFCEVVHAESYWMLHFRVLSWPQWGLPTIMTGRVATEDDLSYRSVIAQQLNYTACTLRLRLNLTFKKNDEMQFMHLKLQCTWSVRNLKFRELEGDNLNENNCLNADKVNQHERNVQFRNLYFEWKIVSIGLIRIWWSCRGSNQAA